MGEPTGVVRVMMLAHELRRQMMDLFAEEAWMTEKGFKPPCVGVLRAVADVGPLSQREISDRIGLDPSDLVGAIDVLEQGGFVERRRDPDDRRRYAVVITAAGRRADERLQVLIAEAGERVLVNLDAGERRRLAALLDKALGDRADLHAAHGAAGRRLPVR
jgi:DNA-binding MarR family transcriptional regulator